MPPVSPLEISNLPVIEERGASWKFVVEVSVKPQNEIAALIP